MNSSFGKESHKRDQGISPADSENDDNSLTTRKMPKK